MKTHLLLLVMLVSTYAQAQEHTDLQRALRRAQYLLNGSTPTDDQFESYSGSLADYKLAIREFVDGPDFYAQVLRYHERLLGVGLDTDYLDELLRSDIDGKTDKFARIRCAKTSGPGARYRCYWSSSDSRAHTAACPVQEEQAVSAFWYPGIVAWACPSVTRACGADLSRCFIEYENEDEARNSEVGATEIFDSRYAVVRSLGRQPAGLAAAVVVNNFPYTKILEPGLTAVDGAIAHLYRQSHHFDLEKLGLNPEVISIASSMSLTDTRFQLVNTGHSYEQGGILSTFGWLRRYEKNRTRANQLYERLLCRKFTSELPRVFPQDPGNLRETPGCMGCHATLDPLADFYKVWGEGGELYTGHQDAVDTSFAGQSGAYLSDLADIVRNDNAFATCSVEHVWEWLIGRKFYNEEADLRAALTRYFVTTNYSFKELVYALATHPTFLDARRSDATVGDPLAEPPLGEPPGGADDRPCNTTINFASDIQPKVTLCAACHGGSNASRQTLATESQWAQWGHQAVSMMASGNMPPGQAGPPQIGAVYDLKEAVRCWKEQNP